MREEQARVAEWMMKRETRSEGKEEQDVRRRAGSSHTPSERGGSHSRKGPNEMRQTTKTTTAVHILGP